MFNKKSTAKPSISGEDVESAIIKISAYSPSDIKVVEIAAYNADEFNQIVETLKEKIKNSEVVYVHRPINSKTGLVEKGSVTFNGGLGDHQN